jgi:hypothetical protein
MQGQPVRATRLLGAAEALVEQTQTPLRAAHQIEFERNVALARAQLDDASFAAAWTAGCAMTLEQAIAYALRLSAGDAEQPARAVATAKNRD